MGIAFSGGIRTPEGFSGDNRTSQAFSGEIGTPAAFSGDNRTPHGLSGKIGTLRGPKLARSRPRTPQASECCPRTHRMSECRPTTTPRPRITRQRHRHRSRAISRGNVAQMFMPVLGASFWRIGKHPDINAAKPQDYTKASCAYQHQIKKIFPLLERTHLRRRGR